MTETTFTVADLQGRLRLLDARIAKAEASVERATRDLEALKAQRVGAEAFIALLAEPLPTTRQKTPNGGITNIVLEIMAAHPEGIANSEIQKIALEQGHSFDAEQVRSSVTYLSRRGDVERTDQRGVWRLKNAAPTNANDSEESESFEPNPPPLRSVAVVGGAATPPH